MTTNVFRELKHRGVAALGLLAESHQDNVVEVAPEPAAQFFRGAFSSFVDGLRSEGAFRAVNDRAGPFRIFLTDGSFEFIRRPASQAVGAMTGEQLVKQDAE